MSTVKDQILREEGQWREATQIAIDAGVLKRCPFHEAVYDPLNGDYEAAYRLANYRYSNGLLDVGFSSRSEMTDTIKAVIDDSGMECGWCAKD